MHWTVNISVFFARRTQAAFPLLALFLVLSLRGAAQTDHVDSLRRDLYGNPDPGQKLKDIFALEDERQSLPLDSVSAYLTLGYRLADLLKSPPLTRYQLEFYRAGYYGKKGVADSTVAILSGFIDKLGADSASAVLRMRAMHLKGTALIRAGKLKEAVAQLYELLEVARAAGDDFYEITAENGIGWAYMDMDQQVNAIQWFYRAIASAKDSSFFEHYSFVYSNLANSYCVLHRYDSAEFFVQKALRSEQRDPNLTARANIISIEADIFQQTGHTDKAGKDLEEVLRLRRQVGDTFYLVSDLAQLAEIYSSGRQTAKSIATADEAIALAERSNLRPKLLGLYRIQAANYKTAGDLERYSRVMEKIVTLKDSISRQNTVDAIAQIKSANDLKIKDAELIEQHARINKRNFQLIGSLIILCLSVIIFFLLYERSRQRQRANMAEALAREKQISEEAVTVAEENQRKRIAADLHDNLGVQANAILYSAELLSQQKDGQELLVSNLHDTAKDMLLSLRETLWAMKSPDVRAADLWLRIISFSKQMQRYYQSVKIGTSGVGPDGFSFNTARALQAVLVVQEAVNNAARHAGASKIEIGSRLTDGIWQIEIRDDGRGFDMAQLKQKEESYGLNNMQNRAVSAGFGLEIWTGPAGTTVLIGLPGDGPSPTTPKGV